MIMSTQVEFLPGPLTSEMSRTAAESALRQHPAIQKGAAFALEQLEGRWVAAVVHQAGPFPPPANGGGPDEEEASPAPKSEGPPGGDESPGDGGEPDGDEGGDKPPSDSGDKPPHEKGGEKGEVHQLLQMLQQIMDALGIPVGMGASPVPGPDAGPVPPPAGPPHGPGGPNEQHVIHERVTKPGETPPGGTPVGAPAFASVKPDHPWAHMAGKVASFDVADQIGDSSLNTIQNELQALASQIGYRVSRLREDRDEQGNRIAVAKITAH